MRSVSLVGANLSGSDLTGAVLWNGMLDGADLSRADLTRAHLGEASLKAAVVVGTEFTESVLPAEARAYLYEAVQGETRWTHRLARETLNQSQFVDRIPQS
jgi:uncharacterized protein YjbI with pentapeptide repeats